MSGSPSRSEDMQGTLVVPGRAPPVGGGGGGGGGEMMIRATSCRSDMTKRLVCIPKRCWLKVLLRVLS